MAERAARLAKADLVTGMVGEFPELQGLMGGYYAAAQGEDPQVASAVRDHYKPVGQGDEVPTAPVTVAVSLADKLDTLAAFFLIGEKPTGSRDPFALRRAALGVLAIIAAGDLRLHISMPLAAALAVLIGKARGEADKAAFEAGVARLEDAGVKFSDESIEKLHAIAVKNSLDSASAIYDELIAPALGSIVAFLADRLKVQQREAGVRHDLIDSVFALPDENDLVRLLARVKALQEFISTEDGTNLLAGYKRAANILKQSLAQAGVSGAEMPASAGMTDLSLAEAALQSALDTAEPKAADAIEGERFGDAMAALASLRGPIDTFFDGVMVNDPDPQKRAFRLGLLARFRDAVHRVADFSKIEG